MQKFLCRKTFVFFWSVVVGINFVFVIVVVVLRKWPFRSEDLMEKVSLPSECHSLRRLNNESKIRKVNGFHSIVCCLLLEGKNTFVKKQKKNGVQHKS